MILLGVLIFLPRGQTHARPLFCVVVSSHGLITQLTVTAPKAKQTEAKYRWPDEDAGISTPSPSGLQPLLPRHRAPHILCTQAETVSSSCREEPVAARVTATLDLRAASRDSNSGDDLEARNPGAQSQRSHDGVA